MSAETTLRPRFKLESTLSPQEIRQRLKAALQDPECNPLRLQHRSAGHHLFIVFPQEQKHFWSPVLDISFEKKGDQGSLIRVLMGPEPAIWTLFVFIYTLGGLASVVGIVLGYSQYSLGHGAGFLLLLPLGLLIVAIFYLAALAGKAKAREQMGQLRDFIHEALA